LARYLADQLVSGLHRCKLSKLSIIVVSQTKSTTRRLNRLLYHRKLFPAREIGGPCIMTTTDTDSDSGYLRVFVHTSAFDHQGRKLISECLAFEPDLVYKKMRGYVLSYPAQYRDAQLGGAMIRLGQFDLFSRDQDNRTPLHWTLYRRMEDVVHLLLNAGADAKTHCGPIFENVLQLAISILGCSERMVHLLVEQGVDPHAQENDRGNALQTSIREHSEPLVKHLLQLGVDVNKRSGTYVYPLYAASTSNQVNMMKLLLDHDAKVNNCGGRHGSPLGTAIHDNNVEIIELLVA
jgi:ankyrin repeat protein